MADQRASPHPRTRTGGVMRPELPVLIKARAKITEPARWGKGSRGYSRSRDSCCAAEAIEDVTLITRPELALRVRAYDALRDAIHCRDLTSWNDAPERTHAEVLAAFDRAIEVAK